ncbi:MAG: hypothetical protein AAF497_15735, partial [Planctomycetota bacterium]
MKRFLAVALLSASFCSLSSAAYIFEIDTDGADDGVLTFNSGFSFGGDTTTASQSAPSTAFGTSGADSLFGGDGGAMPDTYVYRYEPAVDGDNLAVATGTDLGEGDLASGLAAGGAGTYAVYATWPFTTNVSGGLTRYTVASDDGSFSVDINQNDADDLMGAAGRGHVWVKLGEIPFSTGAIEVTQEPTAANSFVSMRAY